MLYASRTAAFLDRVRAGQTCYGVHLSSMSAQVAELFGLLGVDYMIIGDEVESLDRSTMEHLLRAAAASGVLPIVKARRSDPALVQDVLNIGAPMVMVPHIKSRSQLDQIIAASRYMPQGTRGLCPVGRSLAYGALSADETRARTNSTPVIIPILEDKECLTQLDDIMSSPDVDIFELGPFDLSQSLGLSTNNTYANPEIMAAIEKMAQAAKRYNKYLLGPVWYPPEVKHMTDVVERQRQLISNRLTLLYSTDLHVIIRHIREMMPVRELH